MLRCQEEKRNLESFEGCKEERVGGVDFFIEFYNNSCYNRFIKSATDRTVALKLVCYKIVTVKFLRLGQLLFAFLPLL